MQHSQEENVNEPQSPKRWHTRAFDAVLNLLIPGEIEDFDSYSDESDSSSSIVFKLKEEIDELKKQNAMLSQQLSEQRLSNHATLNKECQINEDSIEELRQTIHECNMEKEQLLADQKELMKKLSMCEEKLKISSIRCSKLANENENLRNVIKFKDDEAIRQISELHVLNQDITSQRDHLAKVLQTHHEAFIQFKRVHGMQEQNNVGQVLNVLEQKDDISAYLAEFLSELDEKMRHDLVQLQEENKQLSETLKITENQLALLTRSSEIRRSKLVQDNTQLMQTTAELSERNIVLRENYSKLLTEFKELQEELDREKTAKLSCLVENSKLAANVDELKKKILYLEAQKDGFEIV